MDVPGQRPARFPAILVTSLAIAALWSRPPAGLNLDYLHSVTGLVRWRASDAVRAHEA